WRHRGNDEHGRAATGHDLLMRYVELRRHTDNEGDRLTPQGAADAEVIGRGRLHPPYAAFVSTGAARATPRCWKSCGTRPAKTTPRSPRRRGCGHRWRIAGATRPGQRASERTWRTSGPSTQTWPSASL